MKEPKKEEFGMGDLFIRPDGGLELNITTLMQRPGVWESMEKMSEIARAEVARYRAKQKANNETAEAAAE